MESAGIQTISLLSASLQPLQQQTTNSALLGSLGTETVHLALTVAASVPSRQQILDQAGIDLLPLKSATVLETLDHSITAMGQPANQGLDPSSFAGEDSQITDRLMGLSDQSTLTGIAAEKLNDLPISSMGKGDLSWVDSQIAHDFQQLENLFNTAAQLQQVKALDDLRLVAPTDLTASLDFGLGKTSERGSTIGQMPLGDGDAALPPDDNGFHDPLDGHRNSRPRGSVEAGSMPDQKSLVSQDRGEPVRQSERTSSDGRTTYSHETYADGSRRAERIHRHDDGSSTTTSMEWGSDGEVDSFTSAEYDHATQHVSIETTRLGEDGSKTVYGFEVDQTGAVVRTWGTDGVKCVDPYGSTGGSYVNPFTGQYWGTEIETSNDQVNPDPEAPVSTAASLNFDKDNLVVNPPLNASFGDTSFDPDRFESPNQVNPPEPEF